MSHIVIRTGDGMLLGALENNVAWTFARIANDLGWFSIQTAEIDERMLAVDRILEFYRTPVGAAPVLIGIGFLRSWEWSEDETGQVTLLLQGPDQIDLLARRVVAYNDPEANWKKSGHADDLMKEVVYENMGAGSTDPWYNRGRAYPADAFSVAPDEGLGRDVNMEFQYRNTLAVLQALADSSGWGSGDDGWIGYPVWFDCEYIGPAQFVFRTWVPLRGVDRSLGTAIAPLIFSKEAGNLENPTLKFDYSEEENIVYGLGPGEGTARMVDPENDQVRERLSPWNLHEGVAPATEETTMDGIADRAFKQMQEKRPRVVFSGKLVDTPWSRFGVDWGFGDIVTVRYLGMEFDGRVDSFNMSVDVDGTEVISAAVTITKALEGKPT